MQMGELVRELTVDVVDRLYGGPFHPTTYAAILTGLADAIGLLLQETDAAADRAAATGTPQALVEFFGALSDAALAAAAGPGCGSAGLGGPLRRSTWRDPAGDARARMQAAVAALAAAADVDTPRGSLLRLAKAVPGPAPAGVVRQVAGHPKCRLDVLAVLALTEARRGRRIPRALRDAAGGASLTTLDVLEQISPTTAVLAALAGEWAGTASGLAQAAAGVAG